MSRASGKKCWRALPLQTGCQFDMSALVPYQASHPQLVCVASRRFTPVHARTDMQLFRVTVPSLRSVHSEVP